MHLSDNQNYSSSINIREIDFFFCLEVVNVEGVARCFCDGGGLDRMSFVPFHRKLCLLVTGEDTRTKGRMSLVDGLPVPVRPSHTSTLYPYQSAPSGSQGELSSVSPTARAMRTITCFARWVYSDSRKWLGPSSPMSSGPGNGPPFHRC